MAIRMTGLNSGLNTESIVAALMSAQRTKQTKIENKKTKLEWKQEVWSSLNTKIYDFYKNSLAKIRMQSNYRTKAATSSNTSKVTATASTNAATGSYAITVDKIASAQSVVGGKIKGEEVTDSDGKNPTIKTASSKSKLKDLIGADGKKNFEAGQQIKITTGNGEDAKTVYLDVDEDTTVQNFIDKLTGAGLNASFDEKQQRFFISSNKSGEGNKFTITSGEMSAEQKAATKALKDAIGYSTLSSSDKTKANNIMNSLQNGTSVDDVIDQLTTIANNSQEKDVKDRATKFYTAVAKKEATAKLDEDIRKELEITNGRDLEDKDYADYLNKKGYKINEESSYKTKEEYQKDIESAKDKYIEKKTKELLKTDDYKNKISNAIENGIDTKDVEAAKLDADNDDYDAKNFIFDNRIKRTLDINAKVEQAAKDYAVEMKTPVNSDSGTALKSLGLGEITGAPTETVTDDTQMAVVAAQNTKITYNGAVIESDTTNISVAGLELNILDKTAEGETVNISVTNDTSAIYDTIKDFITEYNSILKEMNKYYGADSAKGYDVLTDEEKDAMSESEIEKWESKIKDSLLRRDTTLSGIVSSFRNNMMGTYTASDGKKYALSSLGITTSADYAEGGLLHILGDEDDAEYADKDNVLKKMLEEDPDTVMQVLTKLSDNLYQDLQKKMSSTKLSGALTFYNDKEMASQLSDYKKDISTWQDKLNDIEDRYYKQFTAMEKALANLQSQQNSLANLIGN